MPMRGGLVLLALACMDEEGTQMKKPQAAAAPKTAAKTAAALYAPFLAEAIVVCDRRCPWVFNEAEIWAAQNCRRTEALASVSRDPPAIKGGGDARNPLCDG